MPIRPRSISEQRRVDRRGPGLVLFVAAGLLMLAGSGCYERVVSGRGVGMSSRPAQDPYSENYLVDNLLFGPPAEPAGKKTIKSSSWSDSVR